MRRTETPKPHRFLGGGVKFPLLPLTTIENAYAAIAHALDHVTREQGVKNDYIFDPDCFIHYTTFIGKRRRLRVVYSRAVQC